MTLLQLFIGFWLALLPAPASAQPSATTPAAGTVRRFAGFASRHVAARNVDVWLPAGYPAAGPYDVLYMHDGQMLFDSTATWNRQEWRVDETLTRLGSALRPCIVVGISNNGPLRHAEYYPEKALAYLPAGVRERVVKEALKGQPLADEYLRFLTQELKPFIDKTFATRPGRAHTFVLGASMGGLISMYALAEYPRVFGGAACLSTHWIGALGADQAAIAASFQRYMREKLPRPGRHRLYFDYGTATLDSLYRPHQLAADAVLQARGYRARDWTTREFAGADHSEKSWARRLPEPLRFLLGR